MGRQRRKESERQWRELLREQRSGGLCVRAFCAERGITEPRFYYWRKELKRRDTEAARWKRGGPGGKSFASPLALAEVLIQEQRPARMPACSLVPPIEIALPSGAVVRVSAGFDAPTLRQVLAVLEQPAC